jgi:hypothetical protein
MNDLPHVRDYVFSQPWVVHEPMLEVIAEVIAGHIAGKVNPAADGLKNIAAKQEVTMVSGMAVGPDAARVPVRQYQRGDQLPGHPKEHGRGHGNRH